MRELAHGIETHESIATEAQQHRLPPRLTALLATTDEEELMESTASLLSALSGAAVHAHRQLDIEYPEVGIISIAEGPLADGVGARLWGISHRFNQILIQKRRLLEGARVLELGSGVGSTGALREPPSRVRTQIGVRCAMRECMRLPAQGTHDMQFILRCSVIVYVACFSHGALTGSGACQLPEPPA